MIIRSQYGSNLINTDICHIGIEQHGEGMCSTWYIMAYGQDHKLQLGRYKNQKQAYHILDTIFDNITNHISHMSLREETVMTQHTNYNQAHLKSKTKNRHLIFK